ncbi:hypothetical protein [Thermogemmatispora carboxidivorans]|uniref:hypothetical protein n=1 Tax=Thermogemmatispora carboxidivorans TaxID=1382306 RepID=UPI000699B8D9|nr:hypothetical protein [Thermogemmatispora carboxidivorans]
MNAVSLTRKRPPEKIWRQFHFASNGLEIMPNPPRVGEAATIRLLVCNETGQSLTVRKVSPRVYSFGIGAPKQEHLPELGPLTLAADPAHVETLTWQWLPTMAGHRCLRVHLDIEGWPDPWVVGCNLQVIEATEDACRWQVPFLLGNPTEKAQPLRLRLNFHSTGLEGGAFQAWVELPQDGRRLVLREPLWLQPHEERFAFLMIRTHPLVAEPFELVSDIEAWLGDAFLDGIRVIVRRRVPVKPLPWSGRSERANTVGRREVEDSTVLAGLPAGLRRSET